MNWNVALGVAAMLQEQLEWDQGKDKLKELAQFVMDNSDDNLGLDENMRNLIQLHQKQALKAHREAAMKMV